MAVDFNRWILGIALLSVVVSQSTHKVSHTSESPDTTSRHDETSVTTTTTTAKTTTTTATTVTISTTTVPSLSQPSFNLTRDDGTVCLRATFQATFSISYLASAEGKNTTNKIDVTMPNNAKGSGTCGNESSVLTVTWDHYILRMEFDFQSRMKTDKASNSRDTWNLDKIVFKFNASKLAKSVETGIKTYSSDNKSMITDEGKSYTCKSKSEIVLRKDKLNSTVIMTISDTQIQPFNMTNGMFSEAEECAADENHDNKVKENNVIPVIVAGTLASIILIIIVVYFVVKTRQKQAYKSMD